jgi:gliding motility-associated-like protein
MRRLFIFISALTLVSLSSLYGQVSIIVSDNTACGSLESLVFLDPPSAYDTITSISWSIAENNRSLDGDSIVLQLETPGTYTLKALVNQSTQIIFSDKLNVYPVPSSEFRYSHTGSSSEYSYLFELSDHEDIVGSNYEWQINYELEGNARELLHTFEETGSHTVQLTAKDVNGCESSSSKEIIIADALQCPNVFTPNLDGFNDIFKVSTDGVTIYSFQVFSKTGIRVYHSESPSISWDGRSLSGVEMQPGIYYYLIENVNDADNDKTSGFVHLIR